VYRWQGEVCDDPELLVLFKTTAEHFEALRALLVAAHPYDCPEVIATPVVAGHAPYLAWVRENVG
jgi:periplasmic divalent cation tolerance protein